MPLLSVVVPVYRVQGYLRECLDSVLGQSFTDIEVIAVDDCSPDSSGEILAEYRERDPRLRVVTLAENVGLGPARNAGLDRAGGEYVWFLDSDDWLAPGALEAVAQRLRAHAPDVLIVNHVRDYWHGEVVGSLMERTCPPERTPDTFALDDWPQVLNILHTAWNKVIRRDFLHGAGLRFAPGWYEDVSFSHPLLALAGRISMLHRVCVHYRQRRTGAITRTVSGRHFEIFDHWERVFAELDARGPRPDRLRPLLFERMIAHYLVVLTKPDRVPPRMRAAFFDRAAADYHRFRPADGYPAPRGRERLKHALLARGARRTFGALRAVWQVHGRVRTALRTAAEGVSRLLADPVRRLRRAGHVAVNRLYYRMQLLRPVDGTLALYAAYWYRGYACNPAAIYERAREIAPRVRGVWVVTAERAATMPAGVPYVVAGTRPYYRALARARWLFNNVNFPDFVVKRRGAVHVMTHHGTPIKAMGLDQRRYPAVSDRTDFARLMRRVDRWDFSISANSFSTQVWERCYPAPYRTLEIGYPRNDRLATATAADVARARRELGVGPGETVALYLPTHREYHEGYRPLAEWDQLAAALGPRWRVLVRAHYFYSGPGVPPLPEPGGAGRLAAVTDVSAHPSVEQLYLAADVLVTDYSSAMVDFAVLDRPIVVYAPDWPVYREMRGVNLDVLDEAPGAVATTAEGLVQVLTSGSYADDAASKSRAEFRRRFCPRDDGRAAERAVRRILLDQSI